MLSIRSHVACACNHRRLTHHSKLRRRSGSDSGSTMIAHAAVSPITDRRAALMIAPLMLFSQAAISSSPAEASEIGNALKGLMLKAQRADGGAMILAPLQVALRRLEEARTAIQTASQIQPSAAVTAIKAVRASSLNCYLFEALPDDDSDTRASLVTQQMQLADPCTFRLIIKNVTDFSNPEVKAKGDELVQAAILSYSKLDNVLADLLQEGGGKSDVRGRALDLLDVTTKAVTSLKDFVKVLLIVE